MSNKIRKVLESEIARLDMRLRDVEPLMAQRNMLLSMMKQLNAGESPSIVESPAAGGVSVVKTHSPQGENTRSVERSKADAPPAPDLPDMCRRHNG